MVRLFIGNLTERVTEEMIGKLFEQHHLEASNIQVKSNYAFVDCPDQESADRAIDGLNRHNLMGEEIQVEPSVSKRRRSNRVYVNNVPPHATEEDISAVFGSFGSIKEINKGRDEGSMAVTYMSPEQAQQAVEQLNGTELLGATLKVEFGNNRRQGGPGGPGAPNQRRQQMGPYRREEFPLRIAVPSEMVGAIIGREGKTIKNITQQSKARVDVLRRENSGSAEKMIVILANQPENCTDACREILKVMYQEAQNNNRGEVPLKILTHNDLCGRLIGKGGNVLKTIMEETVTKIGVSSIHDVTPMYQDRTIEVRGNLEDQVEAQAKIYAKLKTAYENDLRNYKMDPHALYHMNMMGGGMNPGYGMMGRPPYMNMPHGLMPPPPMVANMTGMAGGYHWIPSPYSLVPPYPMHGMNPNMPPRGPGGMLPQAQQGIVVGVHVPSASVGALIGAKGSYINSVKDHSHASVAVESKDKAGVDAPERLVTIRGIPENVWTALWYVFEKIKQEGFISQNYEDPLMRVDMMVPKNMVGKIIGKQGCNVRCITSISQAKITLPEDQTTQAEEVPVQIEGIIYSQVVAQALIRQLLTQGSIQNHNQGGPHNMRGRGRGGGPPRQQQQNGQ